MKNGRYKNQNIAVAWCRLERQRGGAAAQIGGRTGHRAG